MLGDVRITQPDTPVLAAHRVLVMSLNGRETANTIVDGLSPPWLRSRAAGGAAEVYRILEEAHADILILEVAGCAHMMFPLLRRLCTRRPSPSVIVLGAESEARDLIDALNLGASDFMLQPVDPRELAARLRARLRFTDTPPSLLEHGPLTVDLASREVWLTSDAIELSSLEFDLLAFFLTNPYRELRREEILRRVWSRRVPVVETSVDVYVGYLRRKVRSPGYSLPLTAVWGVGYRFGDDRCDGQEVSVSSR